MFPLLRVKYTWNQEGNNLGPPHNHVHPSHWATGPPHSHVHPPTGPPHSHTNPTHHYDQNRNIIYWYIIYGTKQVFFSLPCSKLLCIFHFANYLEAKCLQLSFVFNINWHTVLQYHIKSIIGGIQIVHKLTIFSLHTRYMLYIPHLPYKHNTWWCVCIC